MTIKRITRRRMLGAIGAAGALAALPACRKRGAGGGGQIKVGLIIRRPAATPRSAWT